MNAIGNNLIKKDAWIMALFLMVLVLLSGCSIDMNQFVTLTPVPSSVTSPDTSSTTVPQQLGSSGSPAPTNVKIPITWGNFGLSGKLVFISGGKQPYSITLTIQVINLTNGEISTLYQAPDNSWINSITISPDNKQLVMSYSPPSGSAALYLMPLDGSQAPQLLFPTSVSNAEYYQPDWSPDGNYIYFSQVTHSMTPKPGQQNSDFDLYRIAYPGGLPEKIVSQAFWPVVSVNSKRIAYVTIDPIDGTNKLFLADQDGSNAQAVVMTGKDIPYYIDAPIFSPDGQSITFSALSSVQSSSPTWLEKILGVTVAFAHSIPSDWWTVPLVGGVPTQITHLQTTGLFASVSPDKKYIACNSGIGLFVMNPDGTGLTLLVNDSGGVPGTVTWIP